MTSSRALLWPAVAAAVGVWAAILMMRMRSGVARRQNDVPALLAKISLLSVAVGTLIREGAAERYEESGFTSTILTPSISGSAVTVAQVILVVTAVCAVIVRITRRQWDAPTRLALFVWFPYMLAWGLGALLGAHRGAPPQAWSAAAAFVPIALLPRADQTRRVEDLTVGVARAFVSLSLIVGISHADRAWSPPGAWPGGWWGDAARLQGVLAQPNVLGWIASLLILLELRGRRRRHREIFVLGATVALALSGSRSPSVAAIVALILSGPTPSSRQSGTFRVLKVSSLVGLSIAALQFTRGSRVQSVSGREVSWDRAWSAFREHPISGSGPGAYLRSDIDITAVAYAHNQVLHTAAELGTLGLIALCIHVAAFSMIVKQYAINRGLAKSLLTFWLVLFLPENLLRFTEIGFVVPVMMVALALHASLGDTTDSPARTTPDDAVSRVPPPRSSHVSPLAVNSG
jgi:O-antigen ligase